MEAKNSFDDTLVRMFCGLFVQGSQCADCVARAFDQSRIGEILIAITRSS